MKQIVVSLAFLIAACSGPTSVGRVDVPPPVGGTSTGSGGMGMASAPGTTTDNPATRRWLDEQLGDRGTASGAPAGEGQQPQQPQAQQPQATNEEATRAWLDHTIEQRRAACPDEPPAPIYQTQVVERPVYVDRYQSGGQGGGYDSYGQPVYQQPYQDRYETPFPVHTAVGAGVGAIIGHQSGHQGEGAAIGAGVGLLMDLVRWHW